MEKDRQATPEVWSSMPQGVRPYTVVAFERKADGPLYLRWFAGKAQGGEGKLCRQSLNHRNRKLAEKQARQLAAKLEAGEVQATGEKATVAEVLAAYLQHRTPRKSNSEQKADKRRAELWARVLGNDAYNIPSARLEGFLDARREGRIDAHGLPVKEEDRKPVRARSVEEDVSWIRQVFSWATKWRLPSGQYLLRENCLRGFIAPREKNPRRAIATQDRFEALRAVSDSHMMECRWTKPATIQRSYLSELLDLSNETGRRLSAILGLRFNDLRLREGPDGSIVWRAEMDKTGRETVAPMSAGARAAIDRILSARPGVGATPLLPSPTNRAVPMSRHLAAKWLRECERLADLPKLNGTLWHCFRRKFATELEHLPDVVVASLGGWKSTAMLKVYQQPDANAMYNALVDRRELREVKQG